MNLKKKLLTSLAALSLLGIAGTASAAITADINVYGASAQFIMWRDNAKAYMESQGCTDVVSAEVYSGGKPDGKNAITKGTCGGTDYYFRTSAKASYDGILAMQGNTTHPNRVTECGSAFQRKMADETSCNWTTGQCTGTKCVSVTVGASDVPVECFKQESHGDLKGPLGGGWQDRNFKQNPITWSGAEPCKPLVVPFAFFVNKTVQGIGPVTSVDVTASGSGYNSATVSFSGGGGSGAAATAILAGPVASAAVTDGGSGYSGSSPTVTFSGGGGSGATATATVTGDVVTGITITNGGSGYTSAPTITIADPPDPPGGTTATATAAIDVDVVKAINVTSGGSGYTSPPTVTITGDGSGATAVAYRTIGNITRDNAELIFSGQVYDWSDIVDVNGDAYDAQAIQVCLRHAGSGTHASIDAYLNSDLIFTEDTTGPYNFYHNDGSSDMMKCVNGSGAWTGTGAIGYADADQSLGSYPKTERIALNGVTPGEDTIKNGSYNFYGLQQLYGVAAADALCTFAGNPGNITNPLWVARCKMVYERSKACESFPLGWVGASCP